MLTSFSGDVPINRETNYVVPNAPMYNTQQHNPKRTRSEEIYHSPEKRQRLSLNNGSLHAADDISTIRANASAALKQHLRTSHPIQRSKEQDNFTTDPHLNMRLLSLPILESLVCTTKN